METSNMLLWEGWKAKTFSHWNYFKIQNFLCEKQFIADLTTKKAISAYKNPLLRFVKLFRNIL